MEGRGGAEGPGLELGFEGPGLEGLGFEKPGFEKPGLVPAFLGAAPTDARGGRPSDVLRMARIT
ncbi:hypothetical protein [Beijerinckia indica]|uniref:hypothetical protein n=1 Tax=Beijerinckia indica TaxID=533 RepID=UPI001FCAF226|nr:hypothetical protein [Beijerinckia indica]